MIELELPYPPTINHYYGVKAKGGKYIKDKGRTFRLSVLFIVRKANAGTNISGPIELEIDAYPPDNRKRDLDNINKALLDALENASVFKDDSQIVKLTSTKHAPVKGGKVIVRVLNPEKIAA